MVPLPKITEIKNIQPAIHPIFWLEEVKDSKRCRIYLNFVLQGVELEGSLLKKISTSMTLLSVGTFLRCLGLFFWLIFIVFGVYRAWRATNLQQVAPLAVSPSKSVQSDASEADKTNIQLNKVGLDENGAVNGVRRVY